MDQQRNPVASPTILLVRHGETDLNAEKRVRAWTDVDLSDKGRADTLKTAQAFGHIPVSHIFYSDMHRTAQTAEVLQNHFMVDSTPMRELRPWDVGEYSQFKLSDIKDDLNDLITNPRKKAPGGESFSNFEDRWRQGFQSIVAHAMQNGVTLGVTHSRNLETLNGWLNGGHDPKALVNASSVPPSGVMALSVQDGRLVKLPFGNEHLEKDE